MLTEDPRVHRQYLFQWYVIGGGQIAFKVCTSGTRHLCFFVSLYFAHYSYPKLTAPNLNSANRELATLQITLRYDVTILPMECEMKSIASLFVTLLFLPLVSHAATIISLDGATHIETTLPDPNDLWVTKADLPKANGFELKPEGACLDEICIPIRQSEDSSLFVTRQGTGWVNVTELARILKQAVVTDYDSQTYSLGAIPVQRASFVRDALAPDFELNDWRGETYRLSDFKGKKIMLLSWASW